MSPTTSPGIAWNSTLSTATSPPKSTANALVAIALPSTFVAIVTPARRASETGGVVTERLDRARQDRTAQSREETRQCERGELRASRRHGERRRARFVLADADDRAADAGAAQVPDEEENDDEGAEREEVVRAVVQG